MSDRIKDLLEAGERLEEDESSLPEGVLELRFYEDARTRLPRYRRAIEAARSALPLDTDSGYDHGWNDALTHVKALMERELFRDEVNNGQ